MNTAAILFGLAAMGGIVMLAIRLRGAPQPPTALVLVHGLLALSGLATLGIAEMQSTLPDLACWALAGFGLAALGGAVLFFGFHLRRRPIPIALILGHGAVAATSFALLLKALAE